MHRVEGSYVLVLVPDPLRGEERSGHVGWVIGDQQSVNAAVSIDLLTVPLNMSNSMA